MRIRPRERRQAKVFGVDSPEGSSSEEETHTVANVTKGGPQRKKKAEPTVGATKSRSVASKNDRSVKAPAPRRAAASTAMLQISTATVEDVGITRRPRERRRAKIFGVDASSSSEEEEPAPQKRAIERRGTAKRPVPVAKQLKGELMDSNNSLKPLVVSPSRRVAASVISAAKQDAPVIEEAQGEERKKKPAASHRVHAIAQAKDNAPGGDVLSAMPAASVTEATTITTPHCTEADSPPASVAPQAAHVNRGNGKRGTARHQRNADVPPHGTPQPLPPPPSNLDGAPAAGAADAAAIADNNTTPATPRQTSLSALSHQLVVVPVPSIECFSLHYEEKIGVPFLFTSGECGVWFKDKSCVLLSCEGAKNRLTYVNKHHHRFCITATSEGFIAVPRRLEKKVFCALWCRQHLRSDKSAQPGAECSVSCLPPPSVGGSVSETTVSLWEQCVTMDSLEAFTPFVLHVGVADPRSDTSARGTKVTFYLSNKVLSYPNETYYASDEEPPNDT